MEIETEKGWVNQVDYKEDKLLGKGSATMPTWTLEYVITTCDSEGD